MVRFPPYSEKLYPKEALEFAYYTGRNAARNDLEFGRAGGGEEVDNFGRI